MNFFFADLENSQNINEDDEEYSDAENKSVDELAGNGYNVIGVDDKKSVVSVG